MGEQNEPASIAMVDKVVDTSCSAKRNSDMNMVTGNRGAGMDRNLVNVIFQYIPDESEPTV